MQMRSFKKMAKEKKIKVLTFVIFLCVINWFCEVKAIEVPKLTHIIRDGANGLEGVCIAAERDTYLATDWTYPIRKEYENQPEIVTYFLPNLTSDLDCNFEKEQHCLENWKSDVWRVPEENAKNWEAIFDYRWEDFKIHLITKNTTMLEKRLDIPQDFNITVSIRSDHDVQIWLCEGWLPEKHPCYTIILGAEDGKSVIVKNNKNQTLASNSQEKHILSFDQWKSFQLSSSKSGTIRMVDLTKNVDLVKILDESPLKPIFLFMNSDMPSLWKIHQNNFLYTDVATEVSLGPSINISSINLCVTMFASMCESCNLTFYLKNDGVQDILLYINGSDMNTWKQVRILVSNYTQNQLQLFARTESLEKSGYWMIDNVRLCSPSEVKVKILKNSNKSTFNISDHEISCHALAIQQWRPKPYRMKPAIGSPQVTRNEYNTSLKLSWKPIRIYDNELPFVVKYQGHHLCPENYLLSNASLERIKSNGIVLVKNGEINIKNLIPYTHYSITFIHPIYENLTKEFRANTNGTAKITPSERPKNVRIWTTSTSATVVHEVPSCNNIYGLLLYKYTVNDFVPILSQSTTYNCNDLKPFTNYTVKIETSRNLAGLRSSNGTNVSYYNFTTKPSVAPPVSNLEVFETTRNSTSLRYKLPDVTNGIPDRVYVTYCNGLIKNRCNSVVENITRCVQYPDMYCIHITRLIRNERYTFKLSIKNKDTHTNGEDTVTSAIVLPNVPGQVANITYTVIDCSDIHEYCNFNVTWEHPRHQNGAITSFHIELVEIGTNKGIDDIYLIKNRDYKPVYSHIVRYLPYATRYNISVRASNENLRGNYVTIQGKTDHIGQHIDQIPAVVQVSPYTIKVQIPSLDVRIDKAVITVIVQSIITEHIDQDMWNISNGNLCYEVAKTWIAKVVEFSSSEPLTLLIGDDTTEFSKLYNRTILNKELLPDNQYCLNYVIQNTYKNATHTKVYHWQEMTSSVRPEANELPSGIFKVIMVLLTLIIFGIIIGLILYRYRHRLYCRKVRQDGEHIYEAMPFEDYNEIPNVVYNVTYDKLIHN